MSGHYCVECREAAVGPVCERCGANTVAGFDAGAGSVPLGVDRASALCYAAMGFTAAFVLAVPVFRNNRTVKFHAYQSILVTALIVVAFFTSALFVPLSVREVAMFAVRVVTLALWASLLGLTLIGKNPSLPVIGPVAERQMM
ncbi:MAG: hypothetical protein R2729_19120 [Bryobacteraceae bacterium]